jgi:hypothetical protein
MKRMRVRTPRARETVMFVRVREALEVRREEAAARPAVAAGFGRAVTENEVWMTVETTLVFVAKVVVVVVVMSIFVFVVKVVVVSVEITGRIVSVEVTAVELAAGGGMPKGRRDEGNGNPDGKGKPGGNPKSGPPVACLLCGVTAAVALPLHS